MVMFGQRCMNNQVCEVMKMNKKLLLSKNVLITGGTGSGKTYFLRYLINQILECKEKPVIYIHDLKDVDYRRIVNNLNIFKYNEAEIFELIDRRLEKIKADPSSSFNEVYVIFDELAEVLDSLSDSINNKSNKIRKLSNRFVDFCTSSVSKKIKVYMICATQLPNLLLPSEIKSKFNWYIDIFYDTNAKSDDRYSSLLKTELDSSFNEIFHTNFDKRCLTIYEIEGNDKYIVNKNNEVVIETSDYMLGYSKFIEAVKKIINDNFGFFGNVGLPYSLEAYLCVDDEICGDKKLLEKADDILNLFKQIQQLDVRLTDKKNSTDIQFSDNEWNFKFDAKDGIVMITSKDGLHYLKTNIFNNLKETNQLYFRFCLEKVVSIPSESSRLGEEIKYEIVVNKIY